MRTEKRRPETLVVQITGDSLTAGPELAVTDNVSLHGARIITQARLEVNQHFTLKALGGNLQSEAVVVYCQPLPDRTFAVGLRLLNPSGSWHASPPTLRQHSGM